MERERKERREGRSEGKEEIESKRGFSPEGEFAKIVHRYSVLDRLVC